MADERAIAESLAHVHARMHAACARAHRAPDEVALLAVTKTLPPDVVVAAYEAGQRDFGENYAQELRDKAAALRSLPELRWHAIGPLQTNKVKYVARAAYAFHALEEARIATELGKRRIGHAIK